jgi:NADPH:quinone reductase-like Zn-dependent oxidoreductase
MMAKVKRGGVLASVLGAPKNADKYPGVKVVPVIVQPDAKILQHMAEAAKAGRLTIPVNKKVPLKDADKAHAAVEKGTGKLVLVMAEHPFL